MGGGGGGGVECGGWGGEGNREFPSPVPTRSQDFVTVEI